MSRFIFIILIGIAGCGKDGRITERIPVAQVGKTVLYLDEIPSQLFPGTTGPDSVAVVQSYINRWAKHRLLLLKAEENLPAGMKNNVAKQLEETRANLLIYEYQQQMMLERMDTLITEAELESYYASNEKAFNLSLNIVKALFIKVPYSAPALDKIRLLAHSNSQQEFQQLESLCFQFAEKFDDFNEQWISAGRLLSELPEEIGDQESFLKRKSFYEWNDSTGVVCFLSIRDYRLRSSPAPFDYVRNDIKRIIWNTRRLELIQSLENGIFNEAIREKKFSIY
jgi:hypothetical protein